MTARAATILGVAGVTVAAGLWIRSLGVVSAGAAMIALRASAVPFGDPPSLEALGADVPPLPVALAMPFAALPALRWDPIAPALVGAIAAGLVAWWLVGSLRAIGVGALAAAAIATLATAHPAWVYAAASGSGSVVGAALLVAAIRLYARWQRTADVLPLLASSFAIGLGGLARYDLFVVGWALSLLTLFAPLSGARAGGPLPRAQVLGLVAPAARSARLGDERAPFAIAYATAVTGVLALWMIVSGLLTGDVLGFVARARDAVTGPALAQLPVHALVVMIPALGLAVVCAAMRRGLAAAVAAWAVGLSAVIASTVSGAPLSLDAVVPLVPLCAILLGNVATAAPGARAIAVAAAPALALAGALAVSISPDWGEGHRMVARAVAGEAAPPMWSGERQLAAFVRGDPGRVLVDERVDAVATLLIGAPDRIASIDSLATPAAAAARADLVLVRTPTGRGAAHRVAMAWPTLYDGGAPWARLVATWPAGGEPAEYRLYAVSPVGGR